MGIAQVALDPSPLCQTGKRGKNCPIPSWQAHTTLQATWEKSTENHPGKPLQPPPFMAMPKPEEATHFKSRGKGAHL